MWVDIIQAELHRVSLDNEDYDKSHECLTIDIPGESIGALFLTKDPNVVMVCAKFGLAKADFIAGRIDYVFKYPVPESQAARVRSNDGIIDPWGNLWIGTMNDFPIAKKEGICPEGALYRIDAKTLTVKLMVEGAQIPNGLAFNEDGSKLYWTDSLTFTLWQFDYDNATEELTNRKPLIDMRDVFPEEDSPEPDGLSLSKDGVIYHAVFSTSKVVAYSTEGKAQNVYELPAARPTCTALGGPNDDKLFVTTAHLHLDDFNAEIDPENKSGDQGGFLFCIDLPERANSKPKALWAGEH